MESAPNIRRATREDAAFLSDLALRSKGHWGYDPDFLKDCRNELTLTASYISAHLVYVIEDGRRVVGFYSLRETDTEVELNHLFVEPTAIGRGYGKLLWHHAVESAARLGFRHLVIESDPYAEAFYLAMGAKRVGVKASTVRADRMLPLLNCALEAV